MAIKNTKKNDIPLNGTFRGAGSLNVPMIKQEQKNWCWAACANMILHYYKRAETQCRLSNWAFNQSLCCQTPNSQACDRGLSDAGITQLFSSRYLHSSYIANSVSYVKLDAEISANRPVEVGYSWTNGGGHVAVVIATVIINGREAVRVNDPAYGSVGVYFSDLLLAYGMGRWDATWIEIK